MLSREHFEILKNLTRLGLEAKCKNAWPGKSIFFIIPALNIIFFTIIFYLVKQVFGDANRSFDVYVTYLIVLLFNSAIGQSIHFFRSNKSLFLNTTIPIPITFISTLIPWFIKAIIDILFIIIASYFIYGDVSFTITTLFNGLMFILFTVFTAFFFAVIAVYIPIITIFWQNFSRYLFFITPVFLLNIDSIHINKYFLIIMNPINSVLINFAHHSSSLKVFHNLGLFLFLFILSTVLLTLKFKHKINNIKLLL
jgi:ABC-type polysaccharide/polyol phosphate export permease